MIVIDAKTAIADCLENAFSLKEYMAIIEYVQQDSFEATPSFRKTYNGFYRVRQKSSDWYKKYYELMEKQREDKKSFEEILRALYAVGGCLDVSFASKLMATVDPKLPIWDQYVIQNLGLKSQWEKMRSADFESRIQVAVCIYQNLQEWYINFTNSREGKACIEEFDKALPKYKELLTDVKKVDYLLWSKR